MSGHTAHLIIHADLDAFYAAVEQRDRPELRGKPVIVGGRPEHRGVVATASYEARKFGARSAMPTRTALRLCPQAVLLPPDFPKYRAVSRQVFGIYRSLTPVVEPISLDEAYLDVTGILPGFAAAVAAAEAIRREVRETTALTVSAGVATSKLIAKIASDEAKPDGLKAVPPGDEQSFLWPLPVGRIWGVGRKTEDVLKMMGVTTIGDLARRSREELAARFGKVGAQLHELANGIDRRQVEPERKLQQVSRETTFPEDVADRARLEETLEELAQAVARGLKESGVQGRTVTVKVRYHDFRAAARQATLPEPTDRLEVMLEQGRRLLGTLLRSEEAARLRLLGIGVSNFEPEEGRQLPLPLQLAD